MEGKGRDWKGLERFCSHSIHRSHRNGRDRTRTDWRGREGKGAERTGKERKGKGFFTKGESMTETQLQPIEGPAPYTPEWYEMRPGIIGASEAAKVLGVSRWGGALDVYLDKTGATPPIEENDAMRLGTLLEPVVQAEYERQTGETIETGIPMFLHPVTPWIAATIDGARGGDIRKPWEAKTTSRYLADQWGEEGTDDVPNDALVQCQQQLYVTGGEVVALAVLIDARTLRTYRVHRCEELIDQLVAAETELFQRIQNLDPPEPDFSKANAVDAIRHLHGLAEGTTVQLSFDATTAWLAYEQIGRDVRELNKRRDELKAKVLHAMGSHAIGVMDDGDREIVRKVTERKGFTVEPKSFEAMRARKRKAVPNDPT